MESNEMCSTEKLYYIKNPTANKALSRGNFEPDVFEKNSN